MSQHKTEARRWLDYLRDQRDGNEMYDFFLYSLLREVKNEGLSLADIGTSEKELASLALSP
ncbi:MAG: hypothetical protein AAB956_03775 [Patescibacteria group bacterium]